VSAALAVIDGEIVDETSLLALASTANRCHAEVRASGQTMLESAWHAGQALIAAKAQLRHGKWLPWLAENFNGSQQCANNYMRIASNYQTSSNLDEESIDAALRAMRQCEPQPSDEMGDDTMSSDDDDNEYDQAMQEANMLNAFNALLRPFTDRRAIRKYSPKARNLMAAALKRAIVKLEEHEK
jgi:hypothetical protein